MIGLAPAATLLALLGFSAGCASPEAGRARGGGPGADVGNRTPAVQIHAGAQPFYHTRCVTEPVACQGPRAVFGPTPPPE